MPRWPMSKAGRTDAGGFRDRRRAGRLRQAAALQVMIDKALAVRKDKLGAAFGRIDAAKMLEVERCLTVLLGIPR